MSQGFVVVARRSFGAIGALYIPGGGLAGFGVGEDVGVCGFEDGWVGWCCLDCHDLCNGLDTASCVPDDDTIGCSMLVLSIDGRTDSIALCKQCCVEPVELQKEDRAHHRRKAAAV